jgi:hypothetical protein
MEPRYYRPPHIVGDLKPYGVDVIAEFADFS